MTIRANGIPITVPSVLSAIPMAIVPTVQAQESQTLNLAAGVPGTFTFSLEGSHNIFLTLTNNDPANPVTNATFEEATSEAGPWVQNATITGQLAALLPLAGAGGNGGVAYTPLFSGAGRITLTSAAGANPVVVAVVGTSL